jgi:hypothetical protein
VTAAELQLILQRLNEAPPSSRVSTKRQLLMSAREPIIALYQRGYSWRSLARELSTATGENISADLLRTACAKRPSRRQARRASNVTTTTSTTPKPTEKAPPSGSSNASFGAKGLKL